jgi:hypothetical protein
VDSLQTTSGLPDPFTKLDGTRITAKNEWRCRRQEILKQAEAYIYGEKPAAPDNVTGSVSSNNILVNVEHQGNSISYNSSVTLPSGQGPFPALISVGSGFFGIAQGMKDIALANGVAIIEYDPYGIGAEGTQGSGGFYDIYGSNHSAGLLVAWAWGVSRIIDVLQLDPSTINPSKVAISGCSRFGKSAFIAGALDARLALTIPNESGIGGVPSLRMVPTVDPNGEQPSHGINYQPWFSPSRFQTLANDTSRLPVDTHEMIGMVAPRGLLILDNPHIDNLDPKSAYAASVAGSHIYTALGYPDNISYQGNVSDGNHCAWKSEFNQPLTNNIRKFLKGESATTGGINAHSNGTTNTDSWITWSTPSLSGEL